MIDNDIFLKNTTTIFNKGLYGIIITYDVLFNQNLDELLSEGTNIILNTKGKELLFPEYLEGWLILRDCYVENKNFFNNYVSYTVYFKTIEDMRSIYSQRKIKIKMLVGNKQVC